MFELEYTGEHRRSYAAIAEFLPPCASLIADVVPAFNAVSYAIADLALKKEKTSIMQTDRDIALSTDNQSLSTKFARGEAAGDINRSRRDPPELQPA
jgi:hypothetical protein